MLATDISQLRLSLSILRGVNNGRCNRLSWSDFFLFFLWGVQVNPLVILLSFDIEVLFSFRLTILKSLLLELLKWCEADLNPLVITLQFLNQIGFQRDKFFFNLILYFYKALPGELTIDLKSLESFLRFNKLSFNILLNLIFGRHLIFLQKLHLNQRRVLQQQTESVRCWPLLFWLLHILEILHPSFLICKLLEL